MKSITNNKSRRSSLGGAVRVKATLVEESPSEVCRMSIEEKENGFISNQSNQGLPFKSPVKESIVIESNRKQLFSPVGKAARRISTNVAMHMDETTSSPKRDSSAGTRRSSSDTILRDSLTSMNNIPGRHSGSDADLTNHDREWRVEDFTMIGPLGKGKFGNVYHAKQKRTSVALKVLFKQPMIAANCIKYLKREVEIQCRLKHPNVIELHGISLMSRYFHDAKNVYLILEYVNGSELFRYVHQHDPIYGKITELQCKVFMKDIAAAICYIHSCNVYHRDLKLENILIGNDGKLKIADFGWAVHAVPPHDTRYTMCGTAEYLSPEMILGVGHNSGVDLWAIGIMIYELLLGRTPFHVSVSDNYDNDEDRNLARIEAQTYTYDKIKSYNGKLEFSRSVSRSKRMSSSSQSCDDHDNQPISKQAQGVIQSLLRLSPSERLTAYDLLQSDWLKE